MSSPEPPVLTDVVSESAPAPEAEEEPAAAQQPAVDSSSAAVEQGTAAAPVRTKQLDRVASSWAAEDTNVQLSVEQDQFVRCWLDTRTDIGWIYAESMDGQQSGWLPTFVLDAELPSELRYMAATASVPAEHATQLDLVAGTVYKVHHGSRTSPDAQGAWAYAESVAPAGAEEAKCRGWVPVYALSWSEA